MALDEVVDRKRGSVGIGVAHDAAFGRGVSACAAGELVEAWRCWGKGDREKVRVDFGNGRAAGLVVECPGYSLGGEGPRRKNGCRRKAGACSIDEDRWQAGQYLMRNAVGAIG